MVQLSVWKVGSDANNDIQMGILENQTFVGSYLTAALSALWSFMHGATKVGFEPIFTNAAARIKGGFRKLFGRSPIVFNANH